MYSIMDKLSFTTEIQKSKFICYLINLESIDNIDIYLNKIKKDYNGANHYCYAYIYENKKKCSDDGEPSGTAGMPILNVLENNNLSNILCVVIRYFGGIKLGAGGLVRAYTQSVTNTLEHAELVEIKKGQLIEISFPYNLDKKINYLLKGFNILEKKYEKNIKYKLKLSNNDLKILTDNNISYEILEKDIYI